MLFRSKLLSLARPLRFRHIHNMAESIKPIAQATETPEGSAQPGAMTKSMAKKEAKRAQMAAFKASKQSAAPLNNQAAAPKKEKTDKAPKKSIASTSVYVNKTPKGEKKDMSGEMDAAYDPIAVESAWYDWWEAQGFFKPQFAEDGVSIKPEGSFVIPQPPPNVTGMLHTGHAMMLSLQDALIRWQRMLGKTVLFCPGYDHAGISTQSVVEKRLYKATKQTRHDLGREKLLEKIWEWKEEYQKRITSQTARLGVSCDWSRVAFTMSPSLSKAVNETFVRFHEEGILYRANRLVNFCVHLNTTLSNLEVDQIEITGRKLMHVPGYGDERIEFGVITSFAYPIRDSDEKLIVATTRPETMLGDTGIAVHPDDERYKHLHGKFAVHPFIPDRKIPIILDDQVEMDFGTGAVKVTPAHDPDDYRRGTEHKLEFINILNDDGTLNENAGPEFQGVKRFTARRKVIERLKEIGLYVGAQDNPMSIPVCSKSGDVIEPVMKPQWWVDCKSMAEEAYKRSKAGELVIRPQQSEDEWYRWLSNIQDWCVSRQLWWGHRCPAYYVKIDGGADNWNNGDYWVAGRTLEEAKEKAAKKFPGTTFTLEQDEDVLDTWFSSGLWPFSIMGWPEKTPDLERFYPANVLETGWDILFFWVARMVMLGIKLTGQMPFKEVFCHAMVRDAHGRKMSKSLGNVIDPTDIIEGIPLEKLHEQLLAGNLDAKELQKAKDGQKKDFPKGIPQCGSDALRFTLCNYTAAGRDVNLEVARVEGYRHFCNKLWNATRFAMVNLENFTPNATSARTGHESLVERWILDRLNQAAQGVNKALEARNFMNATNAAYQYWLYELCDVYIEAMKPMMDPSAPAETRQSAQNTLYTCLDHGLRLLNPFMPYVTEELWQRLPRRPGDSTPSIMVASFPVFDPKQQDTEAESLFDTTFAVVKAIRSLAGKYGLQSNWQSFVQSSTLTKQLEQETKTISSLAKGSSSVQVVATAADVPAGCVSEVISKDVVVHLMVKGLINTEAEIQKAEKKQALAQSSLARLQQAAKAPDYEKKIPANVRQKNSAKGVELEAEIKALQEAIDRLKVLDA